MNNDTGKSPGKIFSFERNSQIIQSSNGQPGGSTHGSVREEGYSTLLKNVSMQSLQKGKLQT
jgi:hypothetical protein